MGFLIAKSIDFQNNGNYRSDSYVHILSVRYNKNDELKTQVATASVSIHFSQVFRNNSTKKPLTRFGVTFDYDPSNDNIITKSYAAAKQYLCDNYDCVEDDFSSIV